MARMVTLAEPSSAAQPLFIDFVNTLHWDEGRPIELIGTPAELAHWLADHALPATDGPADLPGLLAFRAHARAVTEALAMGQPVAAADLEALNRALGEPRGRLVLRAADPAARPQLAFELDGDERATATFPIALSLARF